MSLTTQILTHPMSTRLKHERQCYAGMLNGVQSYVNTYSAIRYQELSYTLHGNSLIPRRTAKSNTVLCTMQIQAGTPAGAATAAPTGGDEPSAAAAACFGTPWRTSRPCRARSTNRAVSADAQYAKWLLIALSQGFSAGPVCTHTPRPIYAQESLLPHAHILSR